MEAKKRLARTIVAGFHGEAAAQAADRKTGPACSSRRKPPKTSKQVAIVYNDVAGKMKGELLIRKLLVQMGLAASTTEANRKIAEHAVHWSGDITDDKLRVYLTNIPGLRSGPPGQAAKVAVIG